MLEETRARHRDRQESRDKMYQSLLSQKPHDSDDMFMLPYAEQLKQLPEADKSLLKLKIVQLFHEVRFGTRAAVCQQNYNQQPVQSYQYPSQSTSEYPHGPEAEQTMWHL